MLSPDFNWQFHVATAVRTPKGWQVLDPHIATPLSPREWFTFYQQTNGDLGDLRLYVTAPEKFSVRTSKYSKTQLGWKISREDDWFGHYFVDLLKWFTSSEDPLGEMGLRDLRVQDESEAPGPLYQ